MRDVDDYRWLTGPDAADWHAELAGPLVITRVDGRVMAFVARGS